MVTIPTVNIYNVKTITFETKSIPNTKDKWIGNYNTNVEKALAEYFRRQFRL